MRQFYTKCQIQTPAPYVSRLLDKAMYQSNLIGKKVLENSFGEGNILCEIVHRYIQDGLKRDVTLETIKVGLEKDIIGYEVDPSCIRFCRNRLDKLAYQYGITNVDWDLRNRDFLKDSIAQVDFIIGNPPYITYHDLQEEERLYLKSHFHSCEKGRFDYYYAFIEQSLAWLKPTGNLVYLVPYALLTNKFARSVRRMLSDHLKEIVDFRYMNVFEQVMCTPVSIVYQNDKQVAMIDLTEEKIGLTQQIGKESFIVGDLSTQVCDTRLDSRKDMLTLDDVIRVNNSVATLKNNIFIIPATQQDTNFYYLDEFKIEKDLTLPAVSPRSIALQKSARIIFPYRYKRSKLTPISEEELKTEYPNAYQYLLLHKKELIKRSLLKNMNWYEFGRRQALDIVAQPKLIMSNIVTKRLHVHLIPEKIVPYAGLCITLKNKSNSHKEIIKKLEEIKSILLEEDFLKFLMNNGTPTVGKSLRISVKDIQIYPLLECDKFTI